MNLLPIRYYLAKEDEINSSALNFQDARKGHLCYFYNEGSDPLALIIQDTGEVAITHATFVKVIGDDTKRVLAEVVERVLEMKETYVPKSLHLQFETDINRLKDLR